MRSQIPAVRRSWVPLIVESARVAAAARVVSALVFLLAASVPATVLGVSGLNVEAQIAILRRIDEVGARTVTIVSSQGEAIIPAASVGRIARLDGVSWIVGLGPVFDVRIRQPAGQPTPVRAYRAVGAPVVFSHTSGGGGAFLSVRSAERVGLAGAYSILDPGGIPVVGWFEAGEPLRALAAFILVPSDDDALRLERVIVSVRDVSWVETVAANVGPMIGENAARASTIEASSALLEARAVVHDEVSRRDRMLVLALLGVAMVLAGVVIFAGTLAARRDFGRRRALGATRSQLTVLVVLGTLWPAAAGALGGTAAGWLYLLALLGRPADWQFPVAVGVLAVVALVIASALPAAIAASRDPLRVLRVA